jgi:putative ABC transport system substrate-binding protein
LPVIGFLDVRTPDVIEERLRAYRRGLKEAGYVESENLSILYRFAEGQADRLPLLARELVERRVVAIGTAGDEVAVAAKAAAPTTPVVFIASQDPVKLGLVASLARPGGNATGVNFFSGELTAKRLELLRELLPAATRIAILVNPASSMAAESTLTDAKAAAAAMKLEIQAVNASTRQELDALFASFARERPDALFVGTDTFFTSRRVQLVQLANRHAMPSTFTNREAAEIGGLMSYGTNILEAWRQAGAYVGRIIKGAKPAELPVVQSSKFELVINHQTARMLGLTVPDKLLATADEVIE